MQRTPHRHRKALHPILRDMESEPIREDWLRLAPGERLKRAWAQRKRIRDLEAAHDERSLPRL